MWNVLLPWKSVLDHILITIRSDGTICYNLSTQKYISETLGKYDHSQSTVKDEKINVNKKWNKNSCLDPWFKLWLLFFTEGRKCSQMWFNDLRMPWQHKMLLDCSYDVHKLFVPNKTFFRSIFLACCSCEIDKINWYLFQIFLLSGAHGPRDGYLFIDYMCEAQFLGVFTVFLQFVTFIYLKS